MQALGHPIDEAVMARLASQVARHTDARRVILFGSRATQQATPESDVDLLLLFDRAPPLSEVYARTVDSRAAFPVAVQLAIMDVAAFEETKNVIGGLAFPAAHGGRVLYEKS